LAGLKRRKEGEERRGRVEEGQRKKDESGKRE